MKSKLLSSAMALVWMAASLSSCEKMMLSEGDAQDGQERGNVVIRVAQFEQMPFNSMTRATVGELCTRLNFAVYDESGSRVKQINQKAGDSGFGTVSMTLSEGNYQIVVLAHSSNGNPTMTNLSKINFSNALGFTDTFLFYGELTVDEEETEELITLNRITSLLRFVITDDFPDAAQQIRFQYKGGSGTFDATTGYGNVNSTQTVMIDLDGAQNEFDLYTILKDDEAELTLLVTVYDSGGDVLKEREFKAIPMRRNTITRFSGNFFTGTSGSSYTNSFNFLINDTWDAQIDLSF